MQKKDVVCIKLVSALESGSKSKLTIEYKFAAEKNKTKTNFKKETSWFKTRFFK